jgi:hypothetical protein
MIAADFWGVKAKNPLNQPVTLVFRTIYFAPGSAIVTGYKIRDSVRKKTVRYRPHVLNFPRITRLRGQW